MTLAFILLPLIAAFSMFLVKGKPAGMLALAAAAANFVLTVFTLSGYDTQHPENYTFVQDWLPDLGISFALGLDGISMLLVSLSNLLLPLIILTSFSHTYDKPGMFYGMVLAMQAALNGVFMATDGMLFYIFWELALIPIWFICATWGGKDRLRITFKFFVYTFTGSLLMLVALIYMYLQTPGHHSFAVEELYKVTLSSESASWVFWFLFVGFAIKMPVFPFHTWQPDTYTESPAQGTMLLSGIMLKMGIYGLIRWMIPMAPEAIHGAVNPGIVLAVIGVVYAAVIAIRQNDLKRMVAYSSISHVGLIAAGILAWNTEGLQGGMIQMLSHGINVVGLFFIIDIIESRLKTRDLTQMGGIAKVAPRFAVLYMIIMLGAVAVPLTNGFVGEFLLLNGVFQYGPVTAGIAGLTVIFCAVYMLRMYQFTMFGPSNQLTESFRDVSGREWGVLTFIAALVLVLGIYPQPVFDLTGPAIQKIMEQVSGGALSLK